MAIYLTLIELISLICMVWFWMMTKTCLWWFKNSSAIISNGLVSACFQQLQ